MMLDSKKKQYPFHPSTEECCALVCFEQWTMFVKSSKSSHDATKRSCVQSARFQVLVSRPSSCATRSHMVTSAPLSEFSVSHISNHNWNPRPKWMRQVWEKLLVMEGAILNAFFPLVIYETFTLVPFCFFVPVLQIYMYLMLLTW